MSYLQGDTIQLKFNNETSRYVSARFNGYYHHSDLWAFLESVHAYNGKGEEKTIVVNRDVKSNDYNESNKNLILSCRLVLTEKTMIEYKKPEFVIFKL